MSDFKGIRLTVKDINNHNKEDKFVEAVSALAKAMQVYTTISLEPQGDNHREEMIPVMKTLVQEMGDEYEKVLKGLVIGLARFAGRLSKAGSQFSVPKGVYYNPKTGQPMTKKDWRTLDRAIDDYLALKTDDVAEKLAMRSAAMGAVVGRLEKTGKDPVAMTMQDVSPYLPKKFTFAEVRKHLGWKPEIDKTIRFRTDNIGNYITGLNDDVRNDVRRILTDGLSQQKSVVDIERDLFDAHSNWNRDWRRIASTEAQNSYAEGHLVTEISMSEKDEPIYMIGASAVNACPTCQRDINGKVVRLLPEPPKSGEEYIDDPYTNTAIWLGKNSLGHGNKERWTAVTRHPHCACRWVRYYPETPQGGSRAEAG